ncbi:hypothetical protein Daura_29355 [Dactylosporangium aurantiacum]|uniref:TfoX N-terminal domain-containing protein n=1 Tax=Dactylosporangium aurantiacum TaxID=35754 RepID=A0A9Q9MCG4_9ACTN|nr:hypothetical protein [Dactylosporangium aurantiacum]MDG6106761.1 hypothetical protein [Dactylosporangium aurantiacum]UWZ50904.1 hypothetical protein Daura_29355 [Dactylosporangium aurantiacum]
MAAPTGPGDPPQVRFDALVDRLSTQQGVTVPGPGGRFGAKALRVDARIFAMLVQDRLVVKLPRARVDALVADGQGVRWDANKGTPMREWLAVDPAGTVSWESLADEALGFVRR